MGGFFGAFSSTNCKYDVFFGTDYHSHLGTKLGGLVFFDEAKGYQRQIHTIENTPFRSKFEKDLETWRIFRSRRGNPLRRGGDIPRSRESSVLPKAWERRGRKSQP